MTEWTYVSNLVLTKHVNYNFKIIKIREHTTFHSFHRLRTSPLGSLQMPHLINICNSSKNRLCFTPPICHIAIWPFTEVLYSRKKIRRDLILFAIVTMRLSEIARSIRNNGILPSVLYRLHNLKLFSNSFIWKMLLWDWTYIIVMSILVKVKK